MTALIFKEIEKKKSSSFSIIKKKKKFKERKLKFTLIFQSKIYNKIDYESVSSAW